MDWLQTEPVLIRRPHLDRLIGVFVGCPIHRYARYEAARSVAMAIRNIGD
jgi:hypothetical protein